MTQLEALYGRRCRTPLCWYDYGESVVVGPEIFQQITEKIKMIQEKIKALQSLHKSYHDCSGKYFEIKLLVNLTHKAKVTTTLLLFPKEREKERTKSKEVLKLN